MEGLVLLSSPQLLVSVSCVFEALLTQAMLLRRLTYRTGRDLICSLCSGKSDYTRKLTGVPSSPVSASLLGSSHREAMGMFLVYL